MDIKIIISIISILIIIFILFFIHNYIQIHRKYKKDEKDYFFIYSLRYIIIILPLILISYLIAISLIYEISTAKTELVNSNKNLVHLSTVLDKLSTILDKKSLPNNLTQINESLEQIISILNNKLPEKEERLLSVDLLKSIESEIKSLKNIIKKDYIKSSVTDKIIFYFPIIILIISIFFMVAILLIFSKDFKKRIGGIILFSFALVSLFSIENFINIQLIKELKIEISKGFRVKKFDEIGPFPIGDHKLYGYTKEKMMIKIRRLKKELNNNEVYFIFLIGKSDKIPLGKNIREVYGSNIGLAQARANWVKRLIKKNLPKNNLKIPLIAIGTGPDMVGVNIDKDKLAKDRSVEIYIVKK